MSSRLLDEDYSQTEENIGKAQHFSLNEERPDYEVLTLEHSMETIIPEVGMQIWSGALLLCDYLIHNHRDLDSSTVLDLGAGTGITSIVAAMFAPHVLCTDYLASIVELSERNWERNRDLLSKRSCDQIVFKILDWSSPAAAASESKYTITSDDLKFIEDATLILAAEVIYDEELTDGFFQTIYNLLMKSPPKTVLLTVERRIIFSTDNQDICSPAYEHFLENLNDLVTVDEGLVYFTSEKMNTTFPLYFQYQRVKELELWQITSQICVSP
uniref:Methyltransferase small domain-containing protein n=1 Tax=Arion vulgaris TaxID=1028688 RepID=A0A0B7AYF9_9EUPU